MNLREELSSIRRYYDDVLVPFIDTSLEVLNIIKEKGIVTGSTVFGVQTVDSDVDIILPPNISLTWDDVLREHNGIYLHGTTKNGIMHYSQKDFMSLYVLYDNIIYNLLFMSSNEAYESWKWATEGFIYECKKSPKFKDDIRDKKFRVDYFEKMKNFWIKENKND